ncbi:MAG: elongation factor 1-beta [Candidatus Hodarchaeales archaeon]
MAKIITVFQVVPSSPDLDRESFVKDVVKEKLTVEAGVEFMGMNEKPLAFGLYSIDIYTQAEDSDEGQKSIQTFETLLNEREELQSVEITTQTLGGR